VSEMARPFAIERIGSGATPSMVEATATERTAVAARLRVLDVGALRCDYRLRRIGLTAIEAAGTLKAVVTEICVITLDPFSHTVTEAFTVHFVPSGTEDEEPEPDAIDQIPFDGAAIDLGEAAVEQLALALDPYPRRPGASLPDDDALDVPGPFAALSRLRPKA